MKDQPRVAAGQALDDSGKEARGNCDGASDSQLPGCRISEKFDVPCGLFQLIEGDNATIQKGLRIDRGLDAARVTIEKAYAECVFHVGDRLRDCGLGHGEFCSSLAHAAAPGHGQQDMNIVQLHATAHALLIPVHRACPSRNVMPTSHNYISHLCGEPPHWTWNALSFSNA